MTDFSLQFNAAKSGLRRRRHPFFFVRKEYNCHSSGACGPSFLQKTVRHGRRTPWETARSFSLSSSSSISHDLRPPAQAGPRPTGIVGWGPSPSSHRACVPGGGKVGHRRVNDSASFRLHVISAQFRSGVLLGGLAAHRRPPRFSRGAPRRGYSRVGGAVRSPDQRRGLPRHDACTRPGCIRRGLNPLPFFLALACAANIGSALTLIGNPQNMLIGQYLNLSFGGYLVFAALPTAVSLLFLQGIVLLLFRENFFFPGGKGGTGAALQRLQTAKGESYSVRWCSSFSSPPFPGTSWLSGRREAFC